MISHKHKCIFIHIPKCAGTSIESALGHLDNHQGRGGQDHRSVRMIENPLPLINSLSSKENIKELYRRRREISRKVMNPNNKIQVSADQFQSYYKFTIVRNPWGRAFSWYKNVKRDDVHKKKESVSEDLAFADFLRRFADKGMLQPQTWWLKSFDGSIKMDYIGRFETLSDDYSEVARIIGVPNNTLPHKMKGEQTDYRQHYNNDAYDIVAETYKEEIELFNYTFDDASKQPKKNLAARTTA